MPVIFDFKKDLKNVNRIRFAFLIAITVLVIFMFISNLIAGTADSGTFGVIVLLLGFIAFAFIHVYKEATSPWNFEFYDNKVIYIKKDVKLTVLLQDVKSVKYIGNTLERPKLKFKLKNGEVIECLHGSTYKFLNFCLDYFKGHGIKI